MALLNPAVVGAIVVLTLASTACLIRPTVEPDTVCVRNTDCESTCVQGACTDPVEIRGTCDDSGDCVGALTCEGGVCLNESLGTGELLAAPLTQQIRSTHEFGPATAIVITDINGDQNPDAILTIGIAHEFRVMLGDGDGGFTPHATVPTNDFPASLAAGDLDGDGNLDVVIGHYRDEIVSVLLADGEGSFVSPPSPTAIHPTPGYASRFVHLGDFDHDGNLDAVSGPRDGEGVAVLMGLGNGTFSAAESISTGHETRNVAVGDLTGDTREEIVSFSANGEVRIFQGRSGGAPVENVALQLLAPPGLETVVLADLDADGNLDVVLSSAESEARLGNGDGTFASPITGLGTEATEVRAADLDGDGAMDLIFNDYFAPRVSLGRGDGSFSEPSFTHLGHVSERIAVADINSDGALDVVSSCLSVMCVVLGRGDGTFNTAPAIGMDGTIEKMTLADLNGDVHTDIVLITEVGSVEENQHHVQIMIGSSDDSFTLGSSLTLHDMASLSETGLSVGDLNTDGHDDLLLTTAFTTSTDIGLNTVFGAFSIILGNGDGTVSPPILVPLTAVPRDVALGDMNLDGALDVVIAEQDALGFRVSTLLGSGDGTFPGEARTTVPATPRNIALGHIDSDGVLDAIVSLEDTQSLSVLMGRGDGSFVTSEVQTSGRPFSIAVGHLNDDDHLDVAFEVEERDTLAVLLGVGDGTFSNGAEIPFPAQSPIRSYKRALTLGDLDGDGATDALVGDNLILLRGDGEGSFVLDSHYAVATQETFLSDLDGDQQADVIATDGRSLFFVLGNPQ